MISNICIADQDHETVNPKPKGASLPCIGMYLLQDLSILPQCSINLCRSVIRSPLGINILLCDEESAHTNPTEMLKKVDFNHSHGGNAGKIVNMMSFILKVLVYQVNKIVE